MTTQQTLDIKDFQSQLTRASELIAHRIAHISEAPVVSSATYDDIAAVIPSDLPRVGHGCSTVLDDVEQHIAPYATRIGHPRFLAWITTSPAPAGTLGDILCTGLNQAPLSFKGGPAATVLEEIVLRWFNKLLGFPEGAGGTIVSGGTMANLMGLTVARHHHFPEINEKGIYGLDKKPIIYVSDQGHMSIARSAALLGLGTDNVRSIPADDDCRMRVDLLEEQIVADIQTGFAPFCVVAQAGTVVAGAVDSLNSIADCCQRHNLWMHVDAAYGGAALFTEHGRHLMHGIDRADSVCIDPHKWFFIPLECGCTLFRNREQQIATFRAKAAYLGEENPHDLKNTTFVLSRANRALKVWFALRAYGTDLLQEIVERNMHQARLFHTLCEESQYWQNLAPVALSIACARFIPPRLAQAQLIKQTKHLKQDESTLQEQPVAPTASDAFWNNNRLDALQVAILQRLEQSGEGFMTPASVRGQAGVRLCVANHRTTDDDIRLLFTLITQYGLELSSQMESAGT